MQFGCQVSCPVDLSNTRLLSIAILLVFIPNVHTLLYLPEWKRIDWKPSAIDPYSLAFSSKTQEFLKQVHVSQSLTNHPWYYDRQMDSEKLLNDTLTIRTKRYSKQPIDSLAGKTVRHVWLLAGGPGSDPTPFEAEFLPLYMKDDDMIVYVVFHRGISKNLATWLPSEPTFTQTINNVERLIKSSSVPLDAFGSSQSALDVLCLMLAVMNGSTTNPQSSHYVYGLSYGGHWAMQVASLVDSPPFIATVRPYISGIIVDSGLGPEFRFNRNFDLFHQIGMSLMTSCSANAFCQQLAPPAIVYRGLQLIYQSDKMYTTNPYIAAVISILRSLNTSLADSMQIVFQTLFEYEEVAITIPSSGNNPPITRVLDIRVLILQMLTFIGRGTGDLERFKFLLRLVGVIVIEANKLEGDDPIVCGFGSKLLVPFTRTKLQPLSFTIDTLMNRINTFASPSIQSDMADSRPSGTQFPLPAASLSKFQLPFNHLLFISVFSNEFWDYSVSSSAVSNFSFNTLPVIPAEQIGYVHVIWKHLSAFKMSVVEATVNRFRRFAGVSSRSIQQQYKLPDPSSPIRFLFLASELDARTPLVAIHQTFSRMGTSRKQFLKFKHYGHVIGLGRSKGAVSAISSFLSNQEVSIDNVMKLEGEQSIDWNQNCVSNIGLFTWDMSDASLWLRLGSSFQHFVHVCPVWYLAPISIIAILITVVLFCRWMIRFNRSLSERNTKVEGRIVEQVTKV